MCAVDVGLMNAIERNRRRFLKEGPALAGMAMGVMQPQTVTIPQGLAARRAYGERSHFETSVRENSMPTMISPETAPLGNRRTQ
jgi:hypothetical protein